MKEKGQPGSVYLVGGGPGDPGLITLRAIECLSQADVVVHDRLVNPCLLAYAPQAEWVDVGKRPDHHPVPQEEINALVIELARAGKFVVRLKGGDPFIFGRGGEEALALAEAGIPFEIVPGITSAIAAPAYAGIPVTYRGLSSSVAVFTGHHSDEGSDGQATWQRAALAADTLVILMGVQNLAHIVEGLVAGGRSADTPVALIERGTWATQKTITGTLGDILEHSTAIQAPAVIVVGEVVNLGQVLRWFDRPESRPLLGLRVIHTRPKRIREGRSRAYSELQEDEFSTRLAGLGAEPVHLPVTKIVPTSDVSALDQAIDRLASAEVSTRYDWILFTSANAVNYFFDRVFTQGYDIRVLRNTKLGVVGRATYTALQAYHLNADFIPTSFTGRDLAAEIEVSGQSVLLPRSDAAQPTLVTDLRARGAHVEEVIAYSLQPYDPSPETVSALVERQADVVVFFSPSAVEGMAALLQRIEHPQDIASTLAPHTVACIGSTTASAARALGVRVDIIPSTFSVDGLIEALIRWRAH